MAILTDAFSPSATFMTCPISGHTEPDDKSGEVDPRAAISLARVNWLHARHEIVCFFDLIIGGPLID
jgi:hypothetical protein